MKFLNGVDVEDGHIQLSDTYKIQWGGSNARIDGSNASDYIRLWTSDTERIRVIANGNVGIGTTSPSQKLDVNGNISIATTSGAAASSQISMVGSRAIFGYDGSINSAFMRSSDTSKPLVFGSGTSEFMRIVSSTGNVGIGTTAPSSKLHVNTGNIRIDGGSRHLIVDHGTSSGSPGVILQGTGSNLPFLRWTDGTTIIAGIRANSSGDLRIQTNGFNDRLTITSAGDVGIGTISPAAGLQVALGSTTIPSAGASTASAVFGNSTSDDNYGVAIGASSSGVGYISSQRTDGIATTYNLAIQSNGGFVGVGTDSPDAPLHVLNDSSANVLAKIRIQGGSTSGYGDIGMQSGYIRLFSNGSLCSAWNGSNQFNYINGSTATTLNSNGFGIGTTTPQKKLDVYLGTNDAVASIGGTISSGEYAGLHFGYSETGNSLYRHSAIVFERDDATFGDARGKIHILNSPSGSASANLGDSRLTVLPSGNVGIGTTSPTSLLEISQQLSAVATIDYPYTISSRDDGNSINQTGGEGVGIKFRIAGNAATTPGDSLVGASIAAIRESPGDTDSSTGLGFFVTQNDETLDEAVRIDHAGNVGIGTTSPTRKLNVNGNVGINNQLLLDSANYNEHLSIRRGVYGYNTIVTGTRIDYSPTASTDTFKFLADLQTTGQLNVTGNAIVNGNVGIGTTSPGYKLDIAGALRATGESTFTSNLLFPDNSRIKLGTGNDLQIYHDGSNSFIDNGTGNLTIDSGVHLLARTATGESLANFYANGANEFFYDNSKKLETTNTGVTVTGAATATTFIGDLNGTINTLTTAVTKANATSDTTVATTAFVQNLIGTIPAGLVFQGTWNAATNTPTLADGTGTTGHFYIVSTSGSTNLDGITDWVTGDWAVFVEQGTTDAWEKVDNSSVLDGSGTGQKVALWSGSGTSNTLTDAPITVSGNDTTFAGNATLGGSLIGNVGNTTELGTYPNRSIKRIRMVQGGELHFGDTTTSAPLGITEGDWNSFGDSDRMSIYGRNSIKFYSGSVSSALSLTLDTNATFAGNVTATANYTAGNSKIIYKAQRSGGAVAGDWSYDDATTDMSLGTSTAHSFSLKTGNTRALTIDSSQNATFAGDVNVTGGNLNFLANDAAEIKAKESMLFTIDSDNNQTSRVFQFKEGSGNTLMTIQEAGNVGIGTTNPGSILELGSDTPTLTISDTGNNYNDGDVQSVVHLSGRWYSGEANPSADTYSDARMVLRKNYSDGTGGSSLAFETSGAGATGLVEAIRIDKNQNVGIGTTSPSTKLEVISAANEEGIAIKDTSGNLKYKVRQYGGNTYSSFWNASNTEAVRITSGGNSFFNGGNVGIGTTSPGTKLHVGTGSGATVDTGYQAVIDSAGIAGLQILSATNQSGRVVFGDSDDNDIGMIKYDHTDNSMGFRVNGSANEKMRITSAGNVGIGTTDPGAKLEVLADVAKGVLINRTFTTSSQTLANIRAYYALAITPFRGGTGGLYFTNYDADVPIIQSVNTSDAAQSLLLNPLGGNVGIGTTNPGEKLDTPNIAIGGSTITGYTANKLRIDNNGGTSRFYSTGANTTTKGQYVFHVTSSDGSLNPEIMRITAAGNVGIGTTNPDAKLEVAGGSTGIILSNLGDSSAYDAVAMTYNGYNSGTPEFIFQPKTAPGSGIVNSYFRFKTKPNGVAGAGNIANVTIDGSAGIGTTNPQSKLQVDGGIQMAGDTDAASAAKVGTMRYRTGTEYVEVDGTEQVTNGDFATDSDWGKGANTTISGGALNSTAAGVYIIADQTNVVVASKYYKWEVTYTITSGGLRLGASAGVFAGSTQTTTGTYTGVTQINASVNGNIYITSPNSDFVGSIDNISLVEVTAEDASYADMCMQTGASEYEWVNIVRNTY